MVRYLIILSTSFALSYGETKSDIKDTFMTSCKGSYLTAMLNLSKNIDYGKEKKEASDSCQASLELEEEHNTFKDMKTPMFAGCYDAMVAIPSFKMDADSRKQLVKDLQFVFCKDVTGR